MTAKKKILLIDDDKDFLFATKLILEKGGYEVFMAEDGKTWRGDVEVRIAGSGHYRYDDGDMGRGV